MGKRIAITVTDRVAIGHPQGLAGQDADHMVSKDAGLLVVVDDLAPFFMISAYAPLTAWLQSKPVMPRML